jgi:hypothetical protein
MAAINTPVSQTATNTQVQDTVQNPTTTLTAPEGGVVHITLQFRGDNIDPNEIYDIIAAGLGTVASVKGTVARNTWIFLCE